MRNVVFDSQDAFSKAINKIEDTDKIHLSNDAWNKLSKLARIPEKSRAAWVSKAQSRKYHRPGNGE